MKTVFVCFASLLIAVLPCRSAAGFAHANRYGGSMSHSFGSTSRTSAWGTSTTHTAGEGSSRTNAYGGTTEHVYGEGTSHSNVYGGTTEHTYGAGTIHTNAYGGSVTHYTDSGWSKTGAYGGTAYGDAHYGGAYYHPPTTYYPAYHPPTTVNVYGDGCYNCGGWSTAAAAAAGAAVGTIAAGAATSAPAQKSYVMGAIYATLPAGCSSVSQQGQTYFVCDNTWFLPSYGANGVYYRVVPQP